MKHVLYLAIFLGSIAAGSTPVLAQSYPIGACILPTDQWCLPQDTGWPGDPCWCLTDDGWVEGVQN
ncbi:hypothetical protein [Ruegeria hyattellae]|uniref:hypothetical protein n=1 Tax=Ruegeria hyattellae TaxID=3233337 RepID=UPI00355B5B34